MFVCLFLNQFVSCPAFRWKGPCLNVLINLQLALRFGNRLLNLINVMLVEALVTIWLQNINIALAIVWEKIIFYFTCTFWSLLQEHLLKFLVKNLIFFKKIILLILIVDDDKERHGQETCTISNRLVAQTSLAILQETNLIVS